MRATEPFDKSKDQLHEIIKKIHSENSAVGIDAQYTHAIIIDYLREISGRLEAIEKKLHQP